MPNATVVFADVIQSRRDPAGASGRLRDLVGRLDTLYGDERLAPFGFTQGDELQGLLRPSADPLAGVLLAGLADDGLPLRWAIAHGEVDAGTGPATERNGPAFVAAREAIEGARAHRERLVMQTGNVDADELLGDLAPVLAEVLMELTARQRTVARLAILDGLRRTDVANRLGITRSAASVTYRRARVETIRRLSRAVRRLFAAGVGRTDGTGT
jgi:hypothetical protein